jgi:hypothetical protein
MISADFSENFGQSRGSDEKLSPDFEKRINSKE